MSKKSEKQLYRIRKNLLEAIDAALEVHEELIPDHDKYESFLEDMVPSTDGFKVDRDKLRKFREVLYFALIGTFGVDGSDGKSQANVRAHLTDRERYPSPFITEIPYLHKIRESDQIAWAEILRTANLKMSSAARELEDVHRCIESEMRRRGGMELRLRRAKGCENPNCRRGLVKASYEKLRDFKDTCTEFQRDHLRNEPYPDGGRKILCPVCQTEDKESQVQEEE